MTDLQFPICRRQHVSIEHVGPETLVYDEDRHMAFCLNAVSAAVWSLCDGSHSPAQIAGAASLQLGHPVSEEVVHFALDQLRADGLLETAAEGILPAAALSRRTMLARAGAGAILMLPVVAAVMAPRAAQAYTGCVDCTPVDNETPVNSGAPGQSGGPSGPAAPPSNKRQLTPE